MQLESNALRITSPSGAHITEMRFDGPVVLHVRAAENPERYDLKKQEELMELLKVEARKLHGNLSTGIVMKELCDRGIGLRGHVSEAMLLASGECLIHAQLMAPAERDAFARAIVCQRVIYSARRGLEGMEREATHAKTQAILAALLHGRRTATHEAADYAHAWNFVRTALHEIVEAGGDFAKLSPVSLAVLELAGRANLALIVDQTAFALTDIAKKSDLAIRDASAKAPNMAQARAQALQSLGARAEAKGFWERLLE